MINIKAAGADAGSVTVMTDGDCTLAGTVQADAGVISGTGGNGGLVDIECGGNLILAAVAKIVAGSQKSWPSGDVELHNDVAVVQHCSVTHTTACTTRRDCPAGELCVQMQLDGSIQNDGFSGMVDVSTAGAAEINGKITSDTDVNGPDSAGQINIVAVGLTMQSKAILEANAPGNAAGAIAINAVPGDFDLTGKITVKAPAATGVDGTGGTIQVDACNLTVESRGVISADGTAGGENDLTGHKTLTVNAKGTVSAVIGGQNVFVYNESLSTTGAKVNPLFDETQQTFNDCP